MGVNLKFSCSHGFLVFACTWKCGRRSRCTHTMRMRMCVLVVVCVARKLRPCPSYSGCRDRNNSVHWRSLYKGGAGYNSAPGDHLLADYSSLWCFAKGYHACHLSCLWPAPGCWPHALHGHQMLATVTCISYQTLAVVVQLGIHCFHCVPLLGAHVCLVHHQTGATASGHTCAGATGSAMDRQRY